MIYTVREEGREPRKVSGHYPSAAATNYAAVCEPEPKHVARIVKVRQWPLGLVHYTFEVVNHGDMAEATLLEQT